MKIRVNNIDVHYELSGNPTAETVVLSHSLGSSLIMWDAQIEFLRDNYRILRYDTRGHGSSSVPRGAYTMNTLVSDASSLLDALGITRAHWVGLSMGGMIGQGIALRCPERIESLVLCNTAAVIREETKAMWRQRISFVENFGMPKIVDFAMERWFTEAYRAEGHESYLAIREAFLATPVTGYAGCCHAIYNMNFLDTLHQIRMPVHIIAGDQDLVTRVADSLAMHERIEGSSLDIIPGAAHLSNIEQANLFNQSLSRFFAQD